MLPEQVRDGRVLEKRAQNKTNCVHRKERHIAATEAAQ